MSYGRAVPIYKTKTFARFARGEKLTDASLIEAVERAERGLVDAYLGGDVIKQLVARQGQGKRGGFRTLIALRSGDCAVVMFGFAKNERDNIDDDELKALRLIGSQWLNDPAKVAKDLAAGTLIEVNHESHVSETFAADVGDAGVGGRHARQRDH